MEVSERDRRSLKDLAKLASDPAKPKTKSSIATPDSSGFVDLAALAATDPDWLEQAVARAKKAHVAIAEKQEPIEIDEGALGLPRRGGKARKIALGIVALAAAGAVAMLVVRTRHPEPAPIVVSAPPNATQTAAAAAAPAPVPSDIPAPPSSEDATNASAANGSAGDVNANAEAPALNGGEIEDPVKAEPAKKGHGRTARAHGGAQATAPAAAKSDVPKAAPRAGGAQPKFLAGLAAAAPPAAAPAAPAAPQSALGDAMKQASGTANAAPAAKAAPPPPPAPVANTTGLPDKPPTSAVQTALKGAMPSARACLHAGDPDMHVTVVFGSSGAPKSIQATGTGASCVQSAFSRVRVPAFAQPSTSVGFTVRPN